jgi:hypothetical protein
VSNQNGATGGSLLDEIVRDGARAMLAAALAEVAAYIYAHVDEVDENGYRLVVRNGYHGEREVLTSAGAVPVRALRVNDKRIDAETGQRRRFSSAILPAWARKWPRCCRCCTCMACPAGDFAPALEQFPRVRRGPVGGHDHTAHRPVARPRRGVHQALIERHRLRVCICGSTGSISRFAWSRTMCACW